MWLRCVNNRVTVRTGKASQPLMDRRVPLTVGEVYLKMAGPPKEGHFFVINDEDYSRPYPAYLFEPTSADRPADRPMVG